MNKIDSINLAPNEVNEIIQRLNNIYDPFLKLGLIDANIIIKIKKEDNNININCYYPYPCQSRYNEIIQQIQDKLHFLKQKINIFFDFQTHNTNATNVPSYPAIKNIVAISSCKGGVGKSTLTQAIATTLQQEGARVGILDADIYGPSIPLLFNISQDKIDDNASDLLTPIIKDNIAIMSMGFFLNNEVGAWRGPMISKLLLQLIEQTAWPSLDYLIIDMPPGTGDIQMTLCQKIPLSSAVLVSTPQEIATQDVEKGALLFKKFNIPLLGIVENMSYFICPCCQEKTYLFGQDNTKKLAQKLDIETLTPLPFFQKKYQNNKPYHQLAMQITAKIAQLPCQNKNAISIAHQK